MAMPKQLAEGLRRRKARPKGLPPRPLIEDLPAFPISILKGLWPRDWIRCCVLEPGFALTSVRTIKLYRSKVELVLISGKPQTIFFHWQTLNGARRFRFRYQRPIFVCDCGRRAKKLYLLVGLFSCTRCAWRSGTRYASQTG